MLSNYAHSFCKALDSLADLAHDMSEEPARLTDAQFHHRTCELRILRGQCDQLGLDATVGKIDRIVQGNPDDLPGGFAELVKICIDDLRSREFLYIEPTKAAEYHDCLSEWATMIGGPAIAAVPDGERASQCYALGQPTACIFHLMRVMEALIKLLAGRLQVSLTTKDGREKTWGNLATEMQHKVNGFNPAQKEQRTFYNTAVTHLSAVNIAWRTDTMHAYPHQFAKQYTDGEALDILRNVKTFARHFCEGYGKYA